MFFTPIGAIDLRSMGRNKDDGRSSTLESSAHPPFVVEESSDVDVSSEIIDWFQV